MKVKDLIAHLVEMDAGDAEVCVSVTNCFSAFTVEPVEIVSQGFDWDAGKIMLYTRTKLHRYQKCCQRCGLCASRVGERVGTRFFRDGDKSLSLCVYLDGKRRARIPIKPTQEGGAE